MKKKLLFLLLTITCTLSFFGCKSKEETEKTEDTEQVVEEKPVAEEKEVVTDNEYLLGLESDASNYYTVNDAGEVVETFDAKQLSNLLKDNGYNNTDLVMRNAADGVVYYSLYTFESDGSFYKVVAVEPSTNRVQEVVSLDENSFVDYVDIYKGEIYVGSRNSDENSTLEQVFIKNDDFTFTEDDKAWREIQDYFFFTSYTASNLSYARLFDEYDSIFVKSYDYENNEYGFMDDKGNVTNIDDLKDKHINVLGYDEKYILYEELDDSYEAVGFFKYDIENGTEEAIDINSKEFDIGYADGAVYYLASEEKEYNVYTYSIKSYDLESDVETVMYSYDSIPGISYLSSLVSMRGNNVFFAQLDGVDLSWYRLDGENKATSIGATIREHNAYKYGSIIYKTRVESCPKCGTPLDKDYEEAFVLDSKYSEHADEINAVLNGYMEAAIEEVIDLDDQCEYHQETPEFYCETRQVTVDNVQIVNARFLVVDSNGYWYGGGAHGMPYRDEYIFDLNTGEALSFRDFFNGSEEDLKQMVAQKVKEDYESGDGSDYFAATSEEVYDQAYEYVSIDSGNVLFREDGLYYYFYPYDLASYAEGFKEYKFNYQEIFGTDKLTR